MTLSPRDININQLGVRPLFGCLFVYVTQEKAYKLVSFQLGKCLYPFSYTEFNEEFGGTIRFYLSPLFC